MQTSASRVSSEPSRLVDLQGLFDLRRRRDRARVSERLPVGVLAGLGVGRAVVQEERHVDQRPDPGGGPWVGERGVPEDLLTGLL